MRFLNKFLRQSFIKRAFLKRKLAKKGISPLIATVLLIGFTVALAAVVITWGSGFVERVTTGTEERTSKSIACTSDVNFEIQKVVCGLAPGTGKITIDNKGDFELKKIAFRYFDSTGTNKGTNVIEPVAPATFIVGKYEIKDVNLPSTIVAGTNKVEALATVVIDAKEVTCSDAPRTKTFSPAC